MTPSDAPSVGQLNEQLGYPMPEANVIKRIQTVLSQPESAAFVAEVDGAVVGWIHIYVAHIIEAENSYVEIGGLVVDETQRGQGIGTALVKAAERWTIENGFCDIRVRSAIKRVEAREFYEKRGFHVVKTQLRFEKKLN